MRYFVSFAYEGRGQQRFGNKVITVPEPIHSQEDLYAAEEIADLMMIKEMGNPLAVTRLSLLCIMPLDDKP